MSLDSAIPEGQVRLVSNDKKEFTLSKENVLISAFIKTSFEQDPNASEFEVDLRGEVLALIVNYMNEHKGTEPALIEKPLRSRTMADVCPNAADATFIDQIHAQSQQLLYDVTMGALYLHIPGLLHLGCAKVASLIKGHPLDKVKNILLPNGEKA
eukprot:TRINITY_DN93872_c0_g1_i1.p1 TRINITY_DN93872_c0_g1~~TRINITY_DN93872_c0_g1_i1.p1  ORF type:complete len:155 (-),score=34.40 TRINITY_DN93872_c0_g1_i1:90-554(-)